MELKSLPFFKWSEFEDDQCYSIALIGSRYAGKSTLLEQLLAEYIRPKYDFFIFFCNNPQAEVYNNWFKEREKVFIFSKFQPKIIADLDEFQKKTKNFFRFAVIFDDCSSRKGVKMNDMLQQLYIRGRNMNATIVYSTQAHTFITKESRGNLDYLFLGKVNGIELSEAIAKHFLYDRVIPRFFGKTYIRISKTERIDRLIDWMKTNLVDHHFYVTDMRNDREFQLKI